jgi:hypothetical protein
LYVVQTHFLTNFERSSRKLTGNIAVSIPHIQVAMEINFVYGVARFLAVNIHTSSPEQRKLLIALFAYSIKMFVM